MPTNPQPGLKLSDEVVERLAQHLASYYGGEPPSYSPNEAEWRLDAERALTAALCLDDPETLDQIAEALYVRQLNFWVEQGFLRTSPSQWSEVPDDRPIKAELREQARTALAALLGARAEPKEADGGG